LKGLLEETKQTFTDISVTPEKLDFEVNAAGDGSALKKPYLRYSS
jgi:hypothetical protein